MATISIRAVFDPVCPWCYVGSVRLMRARDAYRRAISSGDKINIVWHSYQIDPEAVTQPLMEKMASKFGREQLPRMQELVQFAKSNQGTETEQLSTRLVMEIMKLYFEEGGDITSFKDLGLAAERAGIDRDEAIAWLVNGRGADEVRREVEEAQRMGVRGVPWYEFNGRHVLNGAAEESVFLQRLIQANEDAPTSSK
ncbi:dithiol-disulfide isomerase [Fusarium mexicanum]|uniref:Dithiol-disulfide isomerase n=1 Tax=Fusarium mexicanum TaxID=751941 RepID=A0A8H5IS40_9HYPO|nr:dithiol-disulfide isomerase [Fusarium mexicanum]